ncbi:hypothetical protein INH39_08715 [Massilia violaceinigra]|uniref:Uncharacterized protein n=1 Tax=Massilia violaceinigra TaxID=2045208 RepID=A0ABY4ABI6_9BURK|nr:hypothetical protein [Massilia violaceinigra]UOD31747.1 hypothetical protein INH39_08715 [Massilia violaceinigra]
MPRNASLRAIRALEQLPLDYFRPDQIFSNYFSAHWAKNRIFQGLENPWYRL